MERQVSNARIVALEDGHSDSSRPNMLYLLACPPTADGSAKTNFQPVTVEMAKKKPGPRLHAVVSPIKDTPVTELPDGFTENAVSEITVQGVQLHATAESLGGARCWN